MHPNLKWSACWRMQVKNQKLINKNSNIIELWHLHFDGMAKAQIQNITYAFQRIVRSISSDNSTIVCISKDKFKIFNIVGTDTKYIERTIVSERSTKPSAQLLRPIGSAINGRKSDFLQIPSLVRMALKSSSSHNAFNSLSVRLVCLSIMGLLNAATKSSRKYSVDWKKKTSQPHRKPSFQGLLFKLISSKGQYCKHFQTARGYLPSLFSVPKMLCPKSY